MDKQTQDLAWACLPKEAREEIKKDYKSHPSAYHPYFNEGYGEALKIYFGKHNLTSDTEPQEMLMVERKRIQEDYKHHLKFANDADDQWHSGIIFILSDLFGDKCLPNKAKEQSNPNISATQEELNRATPNKSVYEIAEEIAEKCICPVRKQLNIEQSKPKFKVGDKVIVINNIRAIYPDPMIIKDVSLAEDGKYYYNVIEFGIKFHEDNFEPYTEPEAKDAYEQYKEAEAEKYKNQLKDNMEEKELNLCELLKGYEGEIFYSLIDGDVKLKRVILANQAVEFQCHTYHLKGNLYGSSLDGVCLLYPSRALYEKYPLVAYSAWMEWKESRKPKRWRAEKNEEYWRLDPAFQSIKILESNDSADEELYECGNYFRTEEEAHQAAEAVRECLEKFHELNQKQ